MNPSDKEFLDAVIQGQNEAIARRIPEEYLDSFAGAWAAYQLLMGKQNTSLIPTEDTHGIADFPETFAEWSRQFILESHTDKFVAIAAYLYKQEQKTFVDINDIAAMYKKARWNKPTNLPDVLARAAKRMLFTEAEDAQSDNGLKQWRLTQTGIGHLVNLKKEQ